MSTLAVTCVLLGFVLITVSVFLYEPEEKNIQDTLERWWITVDDQEQTWADRTSQLTRSVARTLGTWLDEVFGRSALSLRALIACLCFTLSSMLLLSFGFGVFTWFKPITRPLPAMRVLAFLFGSGLLFFVGTRQRRSKHYDAFLSFVVALVLGGTTAFFVRTSGNTLGFYAGLAAGSVCNYTVLAFAKRLTLFGTNANHPIVFVAVAMIVAILGLGLLVAPMLAMNTGRFSGLAADLLGFGAISNLFSGTIAASFGLVAIILCLPKATWPLLSRPLYAVARFRVLQSRKKLLFAGISLVGIGIPALSELRDNIVSFFT